MKGYKKCLSFMMRKISGKGRKDSKFKLFVNDLHIAVENSLRCGSKLKIYYRKQFPMKDQNNY